MTRTVRLRPWQKSALDRFVESSAPDFLAVATPGAGKTTFALTAARHQLAGGGGRLIVVAPTAHLKVQWARAAAAFSLHLDPTWTPGAGGLPRDMHGIVTSYQQVATSAGAPRRASRATRSSSSTSSTTQRTTAPGAPSIREAFGGARRRLALSGTPFRSDTRAIPFVAYHGDEAVPDFEYSYGDALADRRVVRPVYFPTTNGQMEWAAPDGSIHSATFDDRLDAARAGQRLRTALSLEGEWLPTVLRTAHARLAEVRREQPNAGGLVIATDQEHARGIASLLLTRFGTTARIVTSDDPAGLGRDRRVRRGVRPVARRGAHGLGGRRHPAPAGRRLRDDDGDRALLPAGGWPLRALDAGRPTPAVVALHPGRSASAPPCRPGRRAAPSLAPSPRDGRAGARRGARHAIAPDEQMSLFAAISAVATDATAFDDPATTSSTTATTTAWTASS